MPYLLLQSRLYGVIPRFKGDGEDVVFAVAYVVMPKVL